MQAWVASATLPHRIEKSSLLSSRTTWWVLGGWAAAFGLATWMIEAVLLHVVPEAPPEPLGGVFRLVETILWLGAIAIATAVAERWPIDDVVSQWKRVLGQLALGIALGPVWGIEAYWLSTFLMPSWRSRGMWGIIATESKGALYGYVITAMLVHVVIRTRRQREREVIAANAVRQAAEARLNLLKLELQPESVLCAMEAVEELIAVDVERANDALVLLSDALYEIAASARVHEVSLRDELAATEVFVRLHELTHRSRVVFVADVDAKLLSAAVPHLLLHPLIESLLGETTGRHSEPVRIELSAERATEGLTLRIATNGMVADRLHDTRTARTVKYARERLAQLYGGDRRFGLTIFEGPRAPWIELTLPFHLIQDRAAPSPAAAG